MNRPIAPDLPSPPADARLPVLAAIAASLVMAVGVLAFDWPAFTVMVLYWAENVFVGLANVLRILVAGARGGAKLFAGSLFIAAFFSVHYGLFTLVHGMFLFSLFGPNRNESNEADVDVDAIGDGLAAIGIDLWLLLAVTVTAVAVLIDLLRWIARTRGAPAGARGDVGALMAAPYGRVVVLHIALLIGAALIAATQAPAAAALLLVALKLGFDLLRLGALRRPSPASR